MAESPSLGEIIAAVARGLDEVTRRVPVALVDVMTRTDTWVELARPVMKQIAEATVRIRDAYDEGVPSGWQALDSEQMLAVIDLMKETGWCLTTTPPPETLNRLLTAPDHASRCYLLLDTEARILNDLDLELRATGTAALPTYLAAAREALEAYASGLYLSSQALSTVTLSALSDARGPLDMRSLGAARTKLKSLNIEEASLRELRFFAVGRAVGTALRTFPRTGDEPLTFNRHASVHALSVRQYNQLNSLTALMLLCGWLREVLWLLRVARETETGN